MPLALLQCVGPFNESIDRRMGERRAVKRLLSALWCWLCNRGPKTSPKRLVVCCVVLACFVLCLAIDGRSSRDKCSSLSLLTQQGQPDIHRQTRWGSTTTRWPGGEMKLNIIHHVSRTPNKTRGYKKRKKKENT